MRIPALLLATLTVAAPLTAQVPERAIRRTIPITNAFQRGLEAGTRDSTGRPGARYWQLRTDYSIDTRLDPVTGIVSGPGDGHDHESERLGAGRAFHPARPEHVHAQGTAVRGRPPPPPPG